MTHYSLNIEKVTPEVKKALDQLRAIAGVTIVPEKSKWEQAIAEGAVTVDEFFDELDERIKLHFRNA